MGIISFYIGLLFRGEVVGKFIGFLSSRGNVLYKGEILIFVGNGYIFEVSVYFFWIRIGLVFKGMLYVRDYRRYCGIVIF